MEDNNSNSQQKHKIWMKNSGYLYDRLMIQKLKWPSLTFQWLPFKEQSKSFVKYRFLYGSHSSGTEQVQHLYVGEVQFPQLKNIDDGPDVSPLPSKMKNICRFNHQYEINRARYKQDDANFFACKMDNTPIAIFQMGKQFPVLLLNEQMGEGFAIEWKNQGLISADFNGDLKIWKDLQRQPQKYHYKDVIEDSRWVTQDIIVTVGDDGYMNFWDLREKDGLVKNILTTTEDKKQVYSVSVNPYSNHMILTGGEDSSVKIWDTRNLSSRLHKFDDHQNSVVTLDWSPFKPNIFASGSLDSKVKIWDLMRVGFEIPKDLGGTDELLFTHEGHHGAVNDISWNPHAMLLGSCEQDKNTIQFYQIVANLFIQSNYLHEFQYTEDVQFLRDQCFG